MKKLIRLAAQALVEIKLNILLVTSQVRGVDGAGGLGDVPVGLANELNTGEGVEVGLAMPGYASISGHGLDDRFGEQNLLMRGLQVPFGDRAVSVDVYQIVVPQTAGSPRIVCYLFRCPEVFDQVDPQTGKVNKDTPDKAILLSRAVLEFIKAFKAVRFDLIHCNDWQTGLIPVYVKTLYKEDAAIKGIATVYTTHNAGTGFQGSYFNAPHWLWLAGLDKSGVFERGQTRSLEHFGNFNFTKGGVAFADLGNTVSFTYLKELHMVAFSGGLDGVFLGRGSDFDGIVNGIDYPEWDPANDPALLPVRFSAKDSVAAVQQAKRRLRSVLREWTVPEKYPTKGTKPFSALRDDTIILATVGRIDFQKIPILFRAISGIVSDRDVQLCILGDAHPNDSLGQKYAEKIEEIAKWSGGKVLFFRGFDLHLSHLLYGCSQGFIIGSVFEPCGLTQLVAMRYGSVPVAARKTGGIADTIIDEADPNSGNRANGFLFKEEVPYGKMIDETVSLDGLLAAAKASDELLEAVRRALRIYRENPERWASLMKNGMARDSSWKAPSLQYLHLYQEAIRRTRLVP
ncbi:MAG: glycogen/starch synthase [Verrucomicrobiota bacterium]